MKINPFILERVRIGLLERREYIKRNHVKFGFYSLCSCLIQDERLSLEDNKDFREYLLKTKTNNTFYLWNGEIDSEWGSWYWMPNDFQSRLDWLNEHIKINSL